MPFVADTDPALMFKVVSEEPAPLHIVDPVIPVPVSDGVKRAMSKEPMKRFAGCREFVSSLSQLINAETQPSVTSENARTTDKGSCILAIPGKLTDINERSRVNLSSEHLSPEFRTDITYLHANSYATVLATIDKRRHCCQRALVKGTFVWRAGFCPAIGRNSRHLFPVMA